MSYFFIFFGLIGDFSASWLARVGKMYVPRHTFSILCTWWEIQCVYLYFYGDCWHCAAFVPPPPSFSYFELHKYFLGGGEGDTTIGVRRIPNGQERRQDRTERLEDV